MHNKHIMQDNKSRNKRIARNTILLYIRMIFLMGVSFFTSRIVLQTLGVEDYGIYNIVGGFISLFGFFNGAISSTTSRYITFAIGKGDANHLNKVFSTCVLTHALIAIIVFVLSETIGFWFVLNKLVIPETRMTAAIWVYQSSVISTVILIVSVPYNAEIVAHEKMSAFAYISILEVILKLAIVYALLIGNVDRLILYSILMLAVQLAIRFIYSCYCNKHFPESKFRWMWDSKLFKELLSFAGWNLWGCVAGALFTQGLNVLLNMFFGPIVNAARGIATQVQGAVAQFSQNFQMALNPQITKNYASGNFLEMHILIARSTKFTFMLLWGVALPVLMETNWILNLWLGQVPEYTIIFIRVMLLIVIVDAMANPLMVAASASGQVRFYQSVIGGILIAIVPISYLVLKYGGSPTSVFVVHLIVACVAFIVRMFIVQPIVKLNIMQYSKCALLPPLYVVLLTTSFACLLQYLMPEGELFSIIEIVVSMLIVVMVSFAVGLSKREKKFLLSKIPFANRL